MQPYFSTPHSNIFLGDSIEIMNSMPEKSVDMVFADPPYAELQQKGITFTELDNPRKMECVACEDAAYVLRKISHV